MLFSARILTKQLKEHNMIKEQELNKAAKLTTRTNW
jgi:hypothetical protein